MRNNKEWIKSNIRPLSKTWRYRHCNKLRLWLCIHMSYANNCRSILGVFRISLLSKRLVGTKGEDREQEWEKMYKSEELTYGHWYKKSVKRHTEKKKKKKGSFDSWVVYFSKWWFYTSMINWFSGIPQTSTQYIPENFQAQCSASVSPGYVTVVAYSYYVSQKDCSTRRKYHGFLEKIITDLIF